ncbi:BTB/POZ and TAZ domain-containing protein 1-like [Cynara cardunculus var. scolymus]|uniref:BTB/POZ and TAZ domain-containing protein 1-like n=1 Tax=Cynara cardunculus var. scolymus TaxID=59895 RepID=UPI000D62DBEF|nr:BTB/POZ and TAZ domain-containing protein 1-like [Cynara cardunculus var. scolymus]
MCRSPASPTEHESDHVLGGSVETIVYILTSGGRRIPANAKIMASASPVLESIIDRPQKHRSSEKTISILGVPCDAVDVFVRFLYSTKCDEDEMEKFGIHLLALSHVYLVPQLKTRCTKALIGRLNIERVVDVLQLARLCDAPDLYLKCMRLISNSFKAVEETEGWKFLQNNDPYLELEILKFIDEAESRKKKTRKHLQEQSLYFQLSEAMDCLQHICTEGCTSVGPYDKEPSKNRAPCSKFSTCEGLQHSIHHFANCKKRVNGGCVRCKRMWQLFKLHSSICESPDSTCRVPLCRQFKIKGQQVRNKKEEARWELLVRKVVAAKAISSLPLPKRKRDQDQEQEPRSFINHHVSVVC